MFKLTSVARCVPLAFVLIASPCHAGWMDNPWGSSLEDLADTAVKGLQFTEPRDGQDASFGNVLAIAPYEAFGLKGFLSFAFRDEGLASVVFTFGGKDQAKTLMILQDQYGGAISSPESSTQQTMIWHWLDADEGNNVRYVHVGGFEPDMIIYTPVLSSEQTGL